MKFEHSRTYGWEASFRGLRHPMESYKRSDSWFGIDCEPEELWDIADLYIEKEYPGLKDEDESAFVNRSSSKEEWLEKNAIITKGSECCEYTILGPNDLDLAQRMIKAGTPNDKFLRQIFVTVDITAPLFWFKEMDTYKVATVANSTSTMHKLASTPITRKCFEMDDYQNIKMYDREPYNLDQYTDDMWDSIICYCETLRLKYLETKDIKYWKELIRILPESWLQTRTWSANYSVLRSIYHWRKDHKLSEWWQFCDWIKELPYANELILFEN